MIKVIRLLFLRLFRPQAYRLHLERLDKLRRQPWLLVPYRFDSIDWYLHSKPPER